MSHIRFEHTIAIPQGSAFKTLGDILRDIVAQESAWQGFALHANLGDAGLPDVGYIAVPVALKMGATTPGINQYPIQIRSASHPESFPTFAGAIAVDMAGNSASMLSLGGSYEVAEACAARVEQREADFMRYSVLHSR